jgi:hypothetical protein
MVWTLVYAHDQNGNPTAGNLHTLITAVEDGAAIRFLLLEPYGVAGADAQWVYVRNGIVYAENTSNISIGFQGNRLVFQSDTFHWFVTISTTGDRDMIRWKVGEHTPGGPGHTNDKIGVRWYADH